MLKSLTHFELFFAFSRKYVYLCTQNLKKAKDKRLMCKDKWLETIDFRLSSYDK